MISKSSETALLLLGPFFPSSCQKWMIKHWSYGELQKPALYWVGCVAVPRNVCFLSATVRTGFTFFSRTVISHKFINIFALHSHKNNVKGQVNYWPGKTWRSRLSTIWLLFIPLPHPAPGPYQHYFPHCSLHKWSVLKYF